MADLQTVKSQVAKAEAELSTARGKLSQSELAAQSQLSQLGVAESKLPSITSQSALRQKFSGIMGQLKRKGIQKVKESIQKQKGSVLSYQKGLKEYGAQLSKYETEKLEPVRQEIRQAEAYNKAVEAVERAAAKDKVWAIAAFGKGLERELAEKYLKQQSLAKQALRSQVQAFEVANPTETLKVDWKNLRVTGVTSGALDKTFTNLKDYNKAITKFNVESQTLKDEALKTPEINVTELAADTISVPTQQNLSEGSFGDKLAAAFNTSGIQMVSAAPSGGGMITGAAVADVPTSSSGGLISSVKDFFKGVKSGAKTGTTAGITGGVVSAYDPADYAKPSFELPEKTFVQKVTSLPSMALASARDYSADVAAQISVEKDLGLGNVASYGYRGQSGDIVTKDVWYGTPLTKVPVGQQAEVSRLQTGINTDIAKLGELDTKIRTLERGNVDSFGKWSGTQADYNKYVNAYNQRENLYTQYQDKVNRYEQVRYVNVLGTKRDIGRFTGKPFQTVTSMITTPVGAAAEQIYYGLNKGDIGKDITFYQEQYGTQQYDALGTPTGFYQPQTRTLTEQDVRGQAELIGKATEFGAGAALYMTPVGGALYAGSIAERLPEYGYNPLEFAKANPVESALLAGTLVGAGGLRAARWAKTPVWRSTDEGLLLTTKGKDFFGTKVRVGGEGRAIEILPSERYLAKFRYSETLPTAKRVDPLIVAKKVPDEIKSLGDTTLSVYKDVKGLSRDIEPGMATDVFLRGGKENYLFSSPYTKEGRQIKARVTEYLGDLGFDAKLVSDAALLRGKAPKITQQDFLGKLLVAEKGGKKATFVEGRTIQSYPIEDLGKIKTRGGTSKVTLYKEATEPLSFSREYKVRPLFEDIGISTRLGRENLGVRGNIKTDLTFSGGKAQSETLYLGKRGEVYSRLDKGADRVTSDVFGISKKRGERTVETLGVSKPGKIAEDVLSLPVNRELVSVRGETFSFPAKEFYSLPRRGKRTAEVYSTVSLRRERLPFETYESIRGPQASRGEVFLLGESLIDSSLGIGGKVSKASRGGTQAQQLLRQAGKTEAQALSSILSPVETKAVKMPSAPDLVVTTKRGTQFLDIAPVLTQRESVKTKTVGPSVMEIRPQKAMTTPKIKTGVLSLGREETRVEKRRAVKSAQRLKAQQKIGIQSSILGQGALSLQQQAKLQKQLVQQRQREKQKQKTVTERVFVSRLDVVGKTPSEVLPTRPPVPKPLKIKIKTSSEDRKKRRVSPLAISPREEFLAITKRRGKEVVVGKAKTARKAERLAKMSALTTLGATAKVRTASGKQIKVTEDPFFRVSKTDPLAVVQKERGRGGGRLASLSERREIKQARKKRGVLSLK